MNIKKCRYWFSELPGDLARNKYIYLMLLPVVAYYLVFHYEPMYGAQIAFKDFSPGKGIWNSPWVGFKYFKEWFNSVYFWRLMRNTLLINVYDVLFGFPAPIILALLLNEIKSRTFKRTAQTVTYLPHFISLVVVCGLIVDFLTNDGLINNILNALGLESIPFMIKPEWFRTIYVTSGIWQGVGWGSIIYLAALSGVDPQLYEAATMDGAGRWKQTWHITLPCIMPTIVIMLILRLGQMLNVGAEKILLLYNPSTYETADVISTYVYRRGLLEMNYSYSTAVGLFNSIINFILLVTFNKVSRRITETSLW
jgi:putative aldouronate transport system permease protein